MADRSAEELLVHAGWLRALALRLVRDNDVADDLVQETWVATMHRTPERSEICEVVAREGDAQPAAHACPQRRPPQRSRTGDAPDRRRRRADARRAGRARRNAAQARRARAAPRRAVSHDGAVALLRGRTAREHRAHAGYPCEHRALAAEDGTGSTARRARCRRPAAGSNGPFRCSRFPRECSWHKRRPSSSLSRSCCCCCSSAACCCFAIAAASDGEHARAASVGRTGCRAASSVRSELALGADPDRPAWLIQPDVKPRRIAGRVTFAVRPRRARPSSSRALPPRVASARPCDARRMQPASSISVHSPRWNSACARRPRNARAPCSMSICETHWCGADKLELALGACDAAMYRHRARRVGRCDREGAHRTARS